MKKYKIQFIKLLVLVSFHILLLFILKYYQNGLQLADFKVSLFGNLINIVVSSLLFLGILLHFLLGIERPPLIYKIFIIASYMMVLPLLILLLLLLFQVDIPSDYIFGLARKKFVSGALFFGSFVSQLFLLTLVWGYLFKTELIVFVHSIIYVFSIILLGVLLTFVFTFVFIDNDHQIDKNKTYEVGVVLGAAVWSSNKPSPIFEARIKKARDLFNDGIIKKIQLTGGNAPGEISEAEAAANLLNNDGIKDSYLLIEEKTSTTSEQIKFIKRKIQKDKSKNSILIISDKFHLIRIIEICKFYDVNADVVPSEYNLNWEKQLFYSFRDSIGLLLFWIFAI